MLLVCRDSFSQGRRRYYIDLRQNQRGRFLKITMLAGNKTFVAIPGDSLSDFKDILAGLLDEHCKEGEESGGSATRPPPQPRNREQQQSPAPHSEILPSKEVHAGGKRFFFDVNQNDRGIFIKFTEVSILCTTARSTLWVVPWGSGILPNCCQFSV